MSFDVKEYIASLGNPDDIFKLELSRKGITELEPDTFSSLTRLQRLDLSYNQISSLPLTIFERNTQLQWLLLSDNKLTSFPPSVFKHLRILKYLFLGGNPALEISSSLFVNLPELKWLDIFDNQVISTFVVHQDCFIAGLSEIEERIEAKQNHKKNWKWVSAELETFPPQPSNYSHLPAFSSSTYLGREGGVDFQEGLEEFKELKAKYS